MPDRPILFSAPMIRALLAGRKTQTRRIFKPQPIDLGGDCWHIETGSGGDFGVPTEEMPRIAPDYLTISTGDRLWVREAWRTQAAFDRQSPASIVADFEAEWGSPSIPTFYEADKRCDGHSAAQWQESPLGRLRASMHMPRCASRITLVVTDIRVQRLGEISEEDAVAEGIEKDSAAGMPGVWGWRDYLRGDDIAKRHFSDPRESYRTLWTAINGPGSWEARPWVAAYTFTVHLHNIDQVAG